MTRWRNYLAYLMCSCGVYLLFFALDALGLFGIGLALCMWWTED